MTTGNTDIDTIAAEPTPLTLVSGLGIEVQRLRTRELMSLLRILTRGAADVLGSMTFGADTTQEEFTGQLLAGLILAIPEAEDEVIEFLNRMVEPVGIVRGRLTKADIATNAELDVQLREELNNPDPADTLTIISEIIKNEAPHILALGKQLGVLIQAQQKSTIAKQGGSSRRSSKA